MSVPMNEFWGNNYYKHPPLTEKMISDAERKLGVKLPAELIELLKLQNGGYTNGLIYLTTKATSWSDTHVPLEDLNGIVADTGIKTAQNILDTEYMTEEWGLPDKQVLLSGNGHSWITLDYRKGDVPTVAWIDVESDEDIQTSLKKFGRWERFKRD
jgi:hypothetical protein